MGPTCSEVLIRTPCPILIAQSDRGWRNAILAADGSDTTRAAEDFFLELGLRNVVVHVRTVADQDPVAGTRPAAIPIAEEELQTGSIVEAAADRVKEEGLSVTRATRAGRPADVLTEMAREVEADVVVLGTHGLTGWRRAVLGSAAFEVAKTSGVSVLIVPRLGQAA